MTRALSIGMLACAACGGPAAGSEATIGGAGHGEMGSAGASASASAGAGAGSGSKSGSGSNAGSGSGSNAGSGSGSGSSSVAGGPGHTGCAIWDGVPTGKTVVVVGQDTAEIEAYGAAFGMPGGVMLYTNVADLPGFGAEVNFGTGAQSLRHWADKAEPLVIQLGVSLKKAVGGDACASDYLASINASALDGPISSMAIELAALRRPVLLRFGYEFDNQDCHRYAPAAYAEAFRHFATLLDTLGAQNVQMVWHAWGAQPLDIAAWYPGDQYVDLVGVSLFPLAEMPGKVEAVAKFAEQHGKPLMIAEAAPQTAHPPSNAGSWDAWYAGVFEFIQRHDVRVLSYINQDWNAQSVWASQGVWGNSRVQGSALEAAWRNALKAPRYLESDPQLYVSVACHD